MSADFLRTDFVRALSRTRCSLAYDHAAHTQVFQRGIYGNLAELSLNNGAEVGPHLTLLLPADGELAQGNLGVAVRDVVENANSLIANQIGLQGNLAKEDKQALLDYVSLYCLCVSIRLCESVLLLSIPIDRYTHISY